MNKEFDLIAHHFSRPAPVGFLGVGDDCALFTVAPHHQLAVSTDLLIQGRHFFDDVDPRTLGHKSLAVNLSDLAAMGARPLACLLSLSLPKVDDHWLAAFAAGFYALADEAGCPLVGGDTTRSASGIVIGVTIMGEVLHGRALRRSAAQVNDDIWVTGMLGAADVALRMLEGRLPTDPAVLASTRQALEQPTPPWQFAQSLLGIAHAALDISDGLAQDLGHILQASHCGAELFYASLPVDPALHGLEASVQQAAVLAGGDVYQLCFTAPAACRPSILALADQAAVQVSRVGRIEQELGLRVRGADGNLIRLEAHGFDHFS